jgi:hypothetical protein
MKTLLLSVTAVTLLGAAFATPSLAMTGEEALAKCAKVKNCAHYDGPGGILIFGPNGGVVDCPDKNSQCTATPRKGAAATRQDNVINQAIHG